MTDDNSSSSPPRSARRSSFAGETLASLFGSGSGQRGSMSRTSIDSNSNGNGPQPTQSVPGPITQAAASAQRRRLSISTLGLSGSPNSSPFGSYNNWRDSYGTGSDSIDESAIEDEPGPGGPTPQTPFGRRMSFGAKALRDVRTGGTTSPGQNGSEGFNWSDNLRTRAARTSIAGGSPGFGGVGYNGASNSPPARRDRSKSVAVMEPPAREMPKPKEQVRPDHFQERILKGDFYMD